MKSNHPKLIVFFSLCLFCLQTVVANTVYTVNNSSADSFMASGSPGNPLGSDLSALNFGGAGTLAIAPASSTKGEFDSILEFNLAGAAAQFNSSYGPGNWQIAGITLSLASNFGTQGAVPTSTVFNSISGGNFGIDLLADNAWVEGTGGGNGTPGYPNNPAVTFDSIPGLLSGGYDSLGTFTYTPPGNNVYESYNLPLDANLVAGAAGGGNVSFYLFAADSQVSYLFNSRSFSSNHPELIVTASAVPEPADMVLFFGLACCGLVQCARNRCN